MASATEINTKADAAVLLIEAGSYSAALPKLLGIKALLATRADGGKGDRSIKWDRAAIDELIADCRREASAAEVSASGIQRSKTVYTRAGSDDE